MMRYLNRGERVALHERLESRFAGDRLAMALLKLHRLSDLEDGLSGRCSGCDQGCSCDLAEWPCRTIELLVERAEIDVDTLVVTL